MKNNILLNFFFFVAVTSFAQQQTFDVANYKSPIGWKKQATENTIQFSKEDAVKGTYCMITLFKSVPGTENSKENFDMAWTSVVKEMVTVSTAPEMQTPETENGWEVQSGYSTFENDGNKGIVVLVTSTGFEKMVNIIILTNTDVYEKEITAFLESVSLKKQTTAANKPATNTAKPVQVNTIAQKDGFAFTTTNFDDGWTSTVQNDWVQVTKGNIMVLIHYPNKQADAYNSVLKDGTNDAWNILVSRRYSNMSNFANRDIQSWESISFVEADLKETSSGKPPLNK